MAASKIPTVESTVHNGWAASGVLCQLRAAAAAASPPQSRRNPGVTSERYVILSGTSAGSGRERSTGPAAVAVTRPVKSAAITNVPLPLTRAILGNAVQRARPAGQVYATLRRTTAPSCVRIDGPERLVRPPQLAQQPAQCRSSHSLPATQRASGDRRRELPQDATPTSPDSAAAGRVQ